MNRKQRRNYEKKYGTTPLIRKVEQDALEKGRLQSLDLILTMVAYTIDYKLELPPEDLCDLMATILNGIDAYRTEHLTKEDFGVIKKELADKGIIIDAKS